MSLMDEHQSIASILQQALEEDLGIDGDITSQVIFPAGSSSTAIIRSKQHGVLSGAYLLAPLFAIIDPALKITLLQNEGAQLAPGTEICRIEGRTTSILAGERIGLNFLQRLSGIATKTARLVQLIQHTHARLLDTRKTTPLLRFLEKKAVVAGGGVNHRFGLYDMILIKDTHIKAVGSVAQAIRTAKAYTRSRPHIKVEIEVQSVKQFREACAERPDRVMLDNMPCDTMAECIAIMRGGNLRFETEASGNITESNIAAAADTGVDFISTGSITHSVQALDIHLILT